MGPRAERQPDPRFSASGRMGGYALVAKRGTVHMAQIGSIGGRKTPLEIRRISGGIGAKVLVEKYGPDVFSRNAQKGGNKVYQLRGSAYMSEIGKRGGRKAAEKRKPQKPRRKD